jgi:hypothetical protein
MKIPVTDELRDVFHRIVDEQKSEDEWAQIESDEIQPPIGFNRVRAICLIRTETLRQMQKTVRLSSTETINRNRSAMAAITSLANISMTAKVNELRRRLTQTEFWTRKLFSSTQAES